MTPNYENADMLDIIFENRNHAYGAYALRRSYNKSLQQAMLITISSVFLLLFGNFVLEKLTRNSISTLPPVLILKPTDIGNPLPKKETQPAQAPKPPKPQVKPPTQASAVAATRNTEIQVVQNNNVQQDTVIPTRELENVNPGEKTNTTAPTNGIGRSDGIGAGNTLDGVKSDEPSPIVFAPEEMPVFPGGEEALMRFLSKNTIYPEMERSSGIQGKTYIQFVVNEDGSITNATVARSASYGFSKEALRVVSLLPKFKPGRQQGHPVRVQYVLPFTFQIKD